jgi:DNA-binding GntR family transcriptional regulator
MQLHKGDNRMNPSKNAIHENCKQDLEKFRSYLSNKPRDLLLFEFLLQNNCTAKSILKIKVKDLFSCKENEVLPLESGDDGDGPVITAPIKRCFNQLLMQSDMEREDLLFKSRKGDKQLTTTSVSRLIRTWLTKLDLGHYKGLHELRKKLGPLAVPDSPYTVDNKDGLNAFSAVAHESIHQIVYKRLVANIIAGTVSPGQKLLPNKIAQQMNVSTTPVREALNRLAAKGFAIHHEKRGWVASELSKVKFKEIFHLRELLECEAISLAAARRTPETLQELEIAQHHYEKVDKENDPIKLFEANRVFHMLAYKDAGSQMMQSIIDQLWDLSSPYYQILFRQSLVPKPTVGINHHVKIVQAIKKQDPKQARYWLKQDIINPVNFIIKLLEMYPKSIE